MALYSSQKAYENYAILRDEMGLSDCAVARKAGIYPSIISRWRNGSWPTIRSMEKIEKATGITIAQILYGPDAK
ncbi:MAG: helix-turn-helix transcriptional regulator [Clostridiaceae bacterium]|nr:helix-turn-helix transcriptional regulator [Clostridiaceae bacterium]